MTGQFRFDNSYLRDLPGSYLAVRPAIPPQPRLLAFNAPLAQEMGLDVPALTAEAAELLSGARLPDGAEPIAQAYAGHQFGGFSSQLGDGRAVLLGEVIGPDGQRRDIQLKGSGRTPFSRSGDGKAAVGPMLREFLIGEALHALQIPTTRALAVVATGEPVWRNVELPGAVLARVAASHIRIGTFQFFAARQDLDKLKALIDYTIARHHPAAAGTDNPALGLFDAVIGAQARLIAQWMGVGFIHGVMNTDNMALSGESIDFGPCAFMDSYAPGTVFSSIDHGGRYAYANQPLILGWNLARLAECLLPFLDPDQNRAVDLANDRLQGIEARYQAEWLAVMRRKLGLTTAQPGDAALAEGFLAAMEGQGVDWTLAFHRLAQAAEGDIVPLRALFADPTALLAWLGGWQARLTPGSVALMRASNPRLIARNHLVEAALEAATAGDMAPFHALVDALRRPFDPDPALERFALAPPQGLAPHVTFCGT